MSGSLIFLIVVALIILFVVGIYNRIVGLNQRGDQAFADIDVQLRPAARSHSRTSSRP